VTRCRVDLIARRPHTRAAYAFFPRGASRTHATPHRCYAVARQHEMLQPQEQTYGMDDKALQSY
jgi:hypothetical protein